MSDETRSSEAPSLDQVHRKPTLRLVGLEEDVEKVLKADADQGTIQPNAYELEDEYHNHYLGAQGDAGVMEPPYPPAMLDRLANENNALSPCIEALVTNIDGTGFDFEKIGEDVENDEDDAKIKALREFFAEPWPGVSFTTMRKEVRRDRERTGNGYYEVLKNANDEIVFIRRVDAKMMRMLKLDGAVPVERSIKRGGTVKTVKVMQRERRFCQMLNGIKLLYFKEFGASRDLNKNTGEWAPAGQRLKAGDRASEIIHLKVMPDNKTPYGIPRWINQTPSVVGSRKAEEFNNSFFDHGGVPPGLIIVQGGTMLDKTRKALEQKLTRGTAESKNRLAVLEVEPTGGSLEKESSVRVTVERFGGERQTDSMFEEFDDKCEARVRRSFRLPPIFVGKADDYSFATAFASYTVAEAQVFKPDRDEDDELFSMKLLPALGYEGYRMISKPLVIEDPNLKLAGIEAAVALGRADPEDIVYEINEAVGTNIKVSEEKPSVTPLPGNTTHTVDGEGNIVPIPGVQPKSMPANSNTKGGTNKTPVPARAPSTTQKSDLDGQTVQGLAIDMMFALRKRDMAKFTKAMSQFSQLDAAGQEAVQVVTSKLSYIDPSLDPEGLKELSACTVQLIAQNQ